MLNKAKLIQSFEEIVGWPYSSPGSNNQYGIDCSGAFVRAYKLQNASIYHGSNRIIRVYCHDQIKISDWTHLFAAAPVFKARSDLSKLNASYRPGGKYYNPALPYDYYHVGLITALEPLTVIHATSPKARKDILCTRNKGESDVSYHDRAVKALLKAGWTWRALLNAVDYDVPPVPEDPDPEPEPEYPVPGSTAVVFAENGLPVKMRAAPTTMSPLWWNVPNGATVTLTGDNRPDWTGIRHNGRSGFMQSRFLLIPIYNG